MITFVTVVHVLVCLFLVVVVLLQHGKGADMGATFGGSSQTVFGARGAATVLSKITVGAAFVFMCTSIGLAYLASNTASKSILRNVKKQEGAAAVPTPNGSPIAIGSPVATTPAPVEPTKAPAAATTKVPAVAPTKVPAAEATPAKQ